MPAFTLNDDDDDPIARRTELADQGLPNYCAAEVIGTDGQEHFALLRYRLGDGADYWPADWSRVAPHDDLGGLPVYWRED